MATPQSLVGHVLREGRLLLGESPEQVGGSIGVAGRTIRRLEEGTTGRPRAITLITLAGYYGLDAHALRWLARRTSAGDELRLELARRVETRGLVPVDDVHELAMMLVRARPARPTREETELDALRADVLLLNDRRRRIVRSLVDELRLAQSEELRRRERAA